MTGPPERKGTRKPKLPKASKIALKALRRALSETGKGPPASNHIPPHTVCVTVEEWRRYAYLMGVSEGEERARQRAFQRAVEALIADGHVCMWGPQIWIP